MTHSLKFRICFPCQGGALKTTEYEYDGLGRLVTENSGNTSMKYAYDRSGNRSSMKVTGISQPYTTSYTYDNNNRMTKETQKYSIGGDREETEYYYDPNGNMISKASGKWEKTIGSMSFSMQPTTTKGSGVYEYNGFNQLVSLYESATNSTCSYTYDADGLRQSKTVNGVTTKHIWDGMNMVAETNGSNAVTSVYTRGKELISSKKGTAVTYYLHNGHGDVNMLMNESGSITKTYTYDAFGVEENKVSSDANPFRYCGEYYDKETDNIYLRARYYSPVQGRFTTEDPAEDGLNWYSYCTGNPVKFVDPSGLSLDNDDPVSGEVTITGSGNMEIVICGQPFKLSDFTEELNDSKNLTIKYTYKNLNIPLHCKRRSDQSNLCWACVSSMIIAYASGKNRDLIDDIAKWSNRYISQTNNPGVVAVDIQGLVNGLGLNEEINSEVIPIWDIPKDAFIDNKDIAQNIINNIDRNVPVVMQYVSPYSSIGHVVLLSGYANIGNKTIFIRNDPDYIKKEYIFAENIEKYHNMDFSYMRVRP